MVPYRGDSTAAAERSPQPGSSRIAIRRVTDEGEPIRMERGGTPNLARTTVLVGVFLRRRSSITTARRATHCARSLSARR